LGSSFSVGNLSRRLSVEVRRGRKTGKVQVYFQVLEEKTGELASAGNIQRLD
jgi:hypothetical protein